MKLQVESSLFASAGLGMNMQKKSESYPKHEVKLQYAMNMKNMQNIQNMGFKLPLVYAEYALPTSSLVAGPGRPAWVR
jgi:hypothetical protein